MVVICRRRSVVLAAITVPLLAAALARPLADGIEMGEAAGIALSFPAGNRTRPSRST